MAELPPVRHDSINSGESKSSGTISADHSQQDRYWSSSGDENESDISIYDVPRTSTSHPSASYNGTDEIEYSTLNPSLPPIFDTDTHAAILYEQHKPPSWKSKSLKQFPTTHNIINSSSMMKDGYVDMLPTFVAEEDEQSYMKIQNEIEKPTVSENRTFRSPGRLAGRRATTLPHSSPTERSPKYNVSLTLQPSKHFDDDHLDVVPSMDNNDVQEVHYSPEAPPNVDRGNKPSPVIDRTRKPVLKKQMSVTESKRRNFSNNSTDLSKSFDSARFQQAYKNAVYVEHELHASNNNTTPFNDMQKLSNDFLYSNHKLTSDFSNILDNSTQLDQDFIDNQEDKSIYHNVEAKNFNARNKIISNGNLPTDNYDNISLKKDITQINNGSVIDDNDFNSTYNNACNDTINNTPIINYKYADLPAVPPPNEVENDLNSCYENVKARHSTSTEMTYIECEAHIPDSVFEEHTEVGKTRNGTHYILVDPLKSAAVKQMR